MSDVMDPKFKIEHILVPHDFSENADEALQRALSIASVYGAHVTIMHAYDVSSVGYPDAYFPNFNQFASQIERAAKEEMAKIAARVRDSSVKVETAVVSGAPAQAIVGFATEPKVDLIVMGTHGRRGISHVLLGSIAEKVVRTAKCPVLTVPLPGRTTASHP
jgi:nucleotide-binding universal stress UspA family protein